MFVWLFAKAPCAESEWRHPELPGDFISSGRFAFCNVCRMDQFCGWNRVIGRREAGGDGELPRRWRKAARASTVMVQGSGGGEVIGQLQATSENDTGFLRAAWEEPARGLVIGIPFIEVLWTRRKLLFLQLPLSNKILKKLSHASMSSVDHWQWNANLVPNCEGRILHVFSNFPIQAKEENCPKSKCFVSIWLNYYGNFVRMILWWRM